eukprot:TRINITY_DN4662_c0_g2_i2.p1 TRINITY_DN4662_c0_g2~~TRINITY_DN4662_c0_g2_i2.p1  ORF type:complete len:395 (+),score=86.88 TRINITY_DN4662_c0_g2_i2:96-1187(+)
MEDQKDATIAKLEERIRFLEGKLQEKTSGQAAQGAAVWPTKPTTSLQPDIDRPHATLKSILIQDLDNVILQSASASQKPLSPEIFDALGECNDRIESGAPGELLSQSQTSFGKLQLSAGHFQWFPLLRSYIAPIFTSFSGKSEVQVDLNSGSARWESRLAEYKKVKLELKEIPNSPGTIQARQEKTDKLLVLARQIIEQLDAGRIEQHRLYSLWSPVDESRVNAESKCLPMLSAAAEQARIATSQASQQLTQLESNYLQVCKEHQQNLAELKRQSELYASSIEAVLKRYEEHMAHARACAREAAELMQRDEVRRSQDVGAVQAMQTIDTQYQRHSEHLTSYVKALASEEKAARMAERTSQKKN